MSRSADFLGFKPGVCHRHKKIGFSERTRNVLRNDRDTELLRSELFSIEQLKRHAVTLAGRHRINPRSGPDRLQPRLADNPRVLLTAYEIVTAAAATPDRPADR